MCLVITLLTELAALAWLPVVALEHIYITHAKAKRRCNLTFLIRNKIEHLFVVNSCFFDATGA